MKFFATFFLCTSCIAQVFKLEHRANSYFRVNEYSEALPYFLKLDSLKPNHPEYNFKIGICLFNSHLKNKSLNYFEKAVKLGYQNREMDIFLGRAYHLNHQWDKAISHYERFKSLKVDTLLLQQSDQNEEIRENHMVAKNLDRYIEMCHYGKKLVEDSLFLTIENLGPVINSKYPDYVPVVSADQNVMIFTSRRDNSTGGKRDINDNKFYEDIYITHKDSATNQWGPPQNMGRHINSPGHDACVGLSPDGQKLFLYRSTVGRRKSGDIMASTLEGTTWSSPILLSTTINSESWDPSASVSVDEKTIFFSSDRPGGYGGTDIYYSTLQPDGQWATPINMGPDINTAYNEDAPYIHPDNKTLFFSSRGHQTMGGFDIFTTVYDDSTKQWSKPENAGYPINTADDDIYFVWSADGSKGYFSSWREDSYGEKDIYVIHRPEATHSVVVVKGKVTDKETKQPLSASITVYDIETNEVVGKLSSNSSSGRYAMVLPLQKKLKASFETDGYEKREEVIAGHKRNPFFEVKKDVSLQKLKIGSVIVFNNIFFDFDKSKIKKESEEDLEKMYQFLLQYPEFHIEVAGHTDARGSADYNQKLSERRAQAVMHWLIKKGISKKRLQAKGYGEALPLSQLETEEGRQLNRRTEFKILDEQNALVEKAKNMDISFENKIKFNIDSSYQNKNGIKTVRRPAKGTVLAQRVTFIQNATESLTEYSTHKLEEIADMMRMLPSLRIEMRVYGNFNGNKEYNKRVSARRSETVFKKLIEMGVEKSRIKIEYFVPVPAETPPSLYDQKSRTVEFIVLN
ncbi:MAG: OmpA family protein [Cytophagaceae bacterium]|jgi:outer membrane protein OmpA-like peptidoglycan-associated protein|nr:OmpA family protein [Cytophagaceae bacterium]